MGTYVALLRGINVGGHRTVAMSDLRDLFDDLGFTGVKTLLQSGNIIFDARRRSTTRLEDLLEKETAKQFGLATNYLVRSATEFKKIVSDNPFAGEAKSDPSHLVVMFLKQSPRAGSLDELRASLHEPESLRCKGKQLYIVYSKGIGRSKLTGTLLERKLRTVGTARNWNTILKLNRLCE